ncbi:MAG TPA: geranylgeranylglycerol-phosphate geranylgeranyltransferase [Chitinophagales bacterium]|nr:geranylgeranylglycerol-phosphate geranylgeranyltransferase [Chitinophagales bacterium]
MNEWLSALLKLIRIQNLLIIAVAQYFVRFFLLNPFFFNYKFALSHSLSDLEFSLLVLATLCIAAAGYIINDYFDMDIDRINKPDKMLIGRYFGRMEAFRLHLVFNISGAILGFASAGLAGNIKLGFIFVVAAGLLWFYAKTLKKIFLLGNIIVSLLTAVTLVLPLFIETRLINNPDGMILKAAYDEMLIPSVLAYALFAFVTTLIREIIKDVEDIEGDRQFGSKSVPVVLGLKGAKAAVAVFCVIMVGLLFVIQTQFFEEEQFLKISYILVALQLPVFGLLFNLVPAASKEDFAKLSEWMKIIMLLGIASMAVFHYV